MAFKIGNNTVIHDADATAAITSSSDLDILQINGTDVLTHVGGTITLKNVTIEDAAESTINTDNITEGSTNLFFTNARAVSALASTTSALAADIVTNATAIALNTGNINIKLPLAGGTLTGALTLSGAPSSANHATTKAYVDTAVSGGAMADTDSLTEGSSNLYYTDARVSSYLSTNNFATHFHSSVQTVTSAQETTNASASVAFTFSELSNAQHYVVFINRLLLRDDEYAVSGTTLTVVTGILAEDDELEVTGFRR